MTSNPSSSFVHNGEYAGNPATYPSSGRTDAGRSIATPTSTLPTSLVPPSSTASSSSFQQTSTTSAFPHPSSVEIFPPPQTRQSPNGNSHDETFRETLGRKRKWTTIGYSPDEVDVMERTATSLHLALLLDQQSTLFPPPSAAFSSFPDVIDRLLPYHIWQIQDDELEGQKKGKKRELRETTEAETMIKRIHDVQKRFANARQADDRTSDLPSLISLLQSSTAAFRDEISTLQQNLRSTRAEYDAMEAVRRVKERVKAEEIARLAKSTISTTLSTAISAGASAQTQESTLAASSPGKAERGRPRGRPRGRGRGGLREAVPTHTPGVDGKDKIREGSPTLAASNISSVPGSTPANPLGPAMVKVAISLIPQFVALGLLVIPTTATDPKAPASVVRTSEDGKNVVLSVDLGACSQHQLQSLAKLLNVGAKPSTDLSMTSPSAAAAVKETMPVGSSSS